ncbi:MAG: hypothetical protein U0931_05895 [Vulcanimicrobiota bacterium]
MEWVPAREWRPREVQPATRARPPRKWGRLSLAAASLAWLLPILVLSWQVTGNAADSAFQQAPRHSTAWLEARVGPPQRVLRFNDAYRIWCYTRGSYQVEVAVDRHNQVCGVSYGRRL